MLHKCKKVPHNFLTMLFDVVILEVFPVNEFSHIMLIVSEGKLRHFWNFIIFLENGKLWCILYLLITFPIFLQRRLQRTVHVHDWWVVSLSWNAVKLHLIYVVNALCLLSRLFHCALSGKFCRQNCWYFLVCVLNKKIKIILGLRAFGTSRILVKIPQELFNFILLLFFMIKFSNLELSISLEIKICVITDKVLEPIISHLKFSFEIGQLVGIEWIERDVFY